MVENVVSSADVSTFFVKKFLVIKVQARWSNF